MIQTDLMNPTLEFLDMDPSIAAEFGGRTDTINHLMSSIADWLGISESFVTLPLMFLFNFAVTWVMVYCFYYRRSHRRDYYSTFILFSSAMFLLLWLMQILDIQTGFVLGLFAIFGMIRYRTETIPIREMTYLFLIIAVSVINSLSLKADGLTWYQLLLANVLILALTFVFDWWSERKRLASKIVLYERIENIVPEKRAELLADIEARTGIKPVSIEIGDVDFLRDVAYIKVNYYLSAGEQNSIGNTVRMKI